MIQKNAVPALKQLLLSLLLMLVVFPASASALWAGNLQVGADESGIDYQFAFCIGSRRIVHFTTYWWPNGSEYSTPTGWRHRKLDAGCWEYELDETRALEPGSYFGQVEVSAGPRHAWTNTAEFGV